MKFAWDAAKSLANQLKHGVSFDEARDLVLVIWTERDEETIRIISARWATKREQGLYHSYLDTMR